MTVRDDLWDVAVDHHGYVTAHDARDLGVPVVELGKLAARGKLERVSYGVYRFPQWPVGPNDPLMEAVLWTRDRKAALSHETALALYELADVNPDKTHVTVTPKSRELQRKQIPAAYAIHYQRLADDQIGWWEHIPAVAIPTAIDQCIDTHVRPDLVLQAIATAERLGRLPPQTAERLEAKLRGDLR
ncbi:MAG: type IV toxin-antitoxin system AbiEi family antitoxin domain-containing protein [Bifidobacteriaceae bacterium]|jgi:predicted transcriptional regulator of viral defense system|nr:type IV toxin-antitoxin system AbiEi family antitoxin domain-containing protein [Bifidobacteriaceae bacterium]